jgi:glutathione S-transferase
MTYTLYGCRRSGSLTVELALAEIGATYDVRDVDLDADAQRDDDYARVNPQRKIPALITPAGETLTESVAILLTLDERHPEARLLPPPGSAERAQALRSLLFVATEIYPLVEINDYPERFAPTDDSAPALRDVARGLWRERWLLVERSIAGDPFLLTSGFCLSDIYIAVVSRWAQQDTWRPAHVPKVEKLTAAVAARPAAAPVWSRHRPETTPGRFG